MLFEANFGERLDMAARHEREISSLASEWLFVKKRHDYVTCSNACTITACNIRCNNVGYKRLSLSIKPATNLNGIKFQSGDIKNLLNWGREWQRDVILFGSQKRRRLAAKIDRTRQSVSRQNCALFLALLSPILLAASIAKVLSASIARASSLFATHNEFMPVSVGFALLNTATLILDC